MHIENCRFCKGKLAKILSLGELPIVNYFPSKEEIPFEKSFPLDFCVCTECGLAQLGFIVPKEKIFYNYHFLTSASKPLVDYLKKLADFCIKEFKLDSKSSILDIGCNDGTLLLSFKEKGIRNLLGIEPSNQIAQKGRNAGVRIISGFFETGISRKISKLGKFDLILATRVLANVVDINDFIQGVSDSLSARGIFVAEVNSLPEMLSKFQFDSIYHEHYSYFSLNTLQKILKKHGLEIFKVEKTPFQGGELRIFAAHAANVPEKLSTEEKITKNDYLNFAGNVKEFKKSFVNLINGEKGPLVGFGAPAKAVTLLNYCGLGADKLSFIVDSTPFKQGRFLPGLHIPIFPEEYLQEKPVDCILLLAWNYKDQVLAKIRKLASKNTKVIIPFPKLNTIRL